MIWMGVLLYLMSSNEHIKSCGGKHYRGEDFFSSDFTVATIILSLLFSIHSLFARFLFVLFLHFVFVILCHLLGVHANSSDSQCTLHVLVYFRQYCQKYMRKKYCFTSARDFFCAWIYFIRYFSNI